MKPPEADMEKAREIANDFYSMGSESTPINPQGWLSKRIAQALAKARAEGSVATTGASATTVLREDVEALVESILSPSYDIRFDALVTFREKYPEYGEAPKP